MLVVVVPLLQEGALLGVQLRADRGPAALRLLRDVYLGREGTAEALHINPGARISRHGRETLEEGRVDGGGDTWVEAAVRVRVGHLVDGGGCGRGRRGSGRRGRGARLHRPRGSEPGQRGGGRAGALELRAGKVREGGAETSGQTGARTTSSYSSSAAVSIDVVVGDGGVHLDLARIYGRGRRSISSRVRQVAAPGPGVLGSAARLKVTQMVGESGVIRGEGAERTAGLGCSPAVVFLGVSGGGGACHPHRLILHVLLTAKATTEGRSASKCLF